MRPWPAALVENPTSAIPKQRVAMDDLVHRVLIVPVRCLDATLTDLPRHL